MTHTSIAVDDMFKFEWVQSPEHSDAAHVVRLSHHLAGCQLLPDPQVPLQNLVSLVGKLAHEQNLVDGGQFAIQLFPSLQDRMQNKVRNWKNEQNLWISFTWLLGTK